MSSAPMCAYCRRRPAAPEWRPFCSERCKMADLGHWIAGDYRVPAAETPHDDVAPPDDLSGSEDDPTGARSR